jgi:uncharacterized protein (DUF433 family)
MTTFASPPSPAPNSSGPQGSRPDRELIPSDSPLAPFISLNPARLNGEPCFRNSRVPIQTLFDHLESDNGLANFLLGFPNVSRDAAVAVIGLAARGMLEGLRRL